MVESKKGNFLPHLFNYMQISELWTVRPPQFPIRMAFNRMVEQFQPSHDDDDDWWLNVGATPTLFYIFFRNEMARNDELNKTKIFPVQHMMAVHQDLSLFAARAVSLHWKKKNKIQFPMNYHWVLKRILNGPRFYRFQCICTLLCCWCTEKIQYAVCVCIFVARRFCLHCCSTFTRRQQTFSVPLLLSLFIDVMNKQLDKRKRMSWTG